MTGCTYYAAEPPALRTYRSGPAREPRTPLADQLTKLVHRIKALPFGPKRDIAENELAEIAGVIRFLDARLDDAVGRIAPTLTGNGLKR